VTTGSIVVRVVIGTIGALLLIGGLAVAVFGGPVAFFAVFCMIVSGAVLLIGVVIEVSRYRPGPGGGEAGLPGPPFARTDEIFVDPTSGHRMRVYIDAATGDRRYVADD
jgi:hypothetical protein